MATIRKRGPKWQVQVRRHGFQAASRSFSQQRDAERWGTLKEREFDLLESQGHKGQVECALTIAGLLVRYRETMDPAKRSGRRETYMVRALEAAPFASHRAQGASPADFKAYRDRRLAQVSPTTVVRELGVLHHVFEVARVDWGYENLANPLALVRKPKLPPGRSRRLAPGEEVRLFATCQTCRGPWMQPLIGFALETGMRLSEIVGARWAHLDLNERLLLVPFTKNDKARTVVVSQEVV